MSKPAFLVIPQWQGSPSSRAMRLVEGAELLREDLPPSARVDVSVPLEAGDALGTPIARLSSLVQARTAAREAITASAARGLGTPILLGGDCASSLAGLEHAAAQGTAEDRLAVLWFDAHPDLQHPSTSPSGAASGMTLRHALGDGAADLTLAEPVPAASVHLVGARAFDPEEFAEAEARSIPTLTPAEDPAAFAEQLVAAVAGATRLYVHIDLDVLDPAEFASVHTPVPFGLTLAQLTAGIRAAVATVPLAGAAICEFAPASRDAAAADLPSVLRVLGALTSALPRSAA